MTGWSVSKAAAMQGSAAFFAPDADCAEKRLSAADDELIHEKES